MKTTLCYCFSFVNFLICCLVLSPAITKGSTQSVFEDWYGDEVLEIKLKVDIDAIYENRKTNNYFPAEFTITNQRAATQSWNIKVKVRGMFRRMKCDFPPLKLNFNKNELLGAGYNDNDKFKLVTHCLNSKEGDANVFKEYLAYQMLYELNPQTYRAQLVRITYVDTNDESQFTNYGILLESTKSLKTRLNAEECENCYNLQRNEVDHYHLNVIAMFNYMIGNTDWSVISNKNIKIFKQKHTGKYLVVAYDFDFSGLVHTSYAMPNVNLALTNVKDRYFLGLPVAPSDLEAVKDYFLQKAPVIFNMVEQQPYLKKGTKNCMKKYLEEFYEQLNGDFSPETVKGLSYIN